MHEIFFLEQLKQKLSTGNRRSIHLDALPEKRLTRLDPMSLSVFDESVPLQFLNTLLSKPKFTFSIRYNTTNKSVHELSSEEFLKLQTVCKQLDAIIFDNNDNYLEHGVSPFAFGYPLLIKTDRSNPKKLIKAPIFIWYLDIVKLTQQQYNYQILRLEDYPIYLNPLLNSHLETDEQISLKNILNEIQDLELLDYTKITQLCNQILLQLNSLEEYPQATLTYCPGGSTLKNIDVSRPIIRWSGVFGLYKTQKQPIIADIDNLIKNYEQIFNANLKQEQNLKTNTHFFSSVATDPSQQAVLQNIANLPNQIIQGPPGTGKSRLLTAIITNALANNNKCLVVCEKRTALEVLQQNLNNLGFQDLNIIIEDISKDRQRVIDSVRNRVDEPTLSPYNNNEAYNLYIEQTQKSIQQIQLQHQFLDKPLLGSFNWTEIVGKLLLSRQIEWNTNLQKQVHKIPFLFNLNEYNSLNKNIEIAKQNYNPINTLTHSLDIINSNLFLTITSGELKVFIENNVETYYTKSLNLQNDIQNILNEYKSKLNLLFKQYYQTFNEQSKQLLQYLQNNLLQYGKNYSDAVGINNLAVKTFSIFSQKHKNALEAQKNTLHLFEQLCNNFNQNPTFTFTFNNTKEINNNTIFLIQEQVNQFNTALQQWFFNIEAIINNLANEFSSKKNYPLINIKSQAIAIEQNYLQVIQEINKNNFLSIHIISEINSLSSCQLNLEFLLSYLSKIKQSMPEFNDFYRWKNFFLQLDEVQKLTITGLINSNANNWQAAFNSAYFNLLLLKHENNSTPKENSELQALKQGLQQIQQQQVQKIYFNWQQLQQAAVNNYNNNQNIKRLYNKRGSKGEKRNSLRHIINTNFDVFTNFFPVLLLNPIVCSSLLPGQLNLFDIVIFDEASQLRLEDTYLALLRGKHKIVSGDMHQMPPSSYFENIQNLMLNESEDIDLEESENTNNNDADLLEKESLLQYAEDMGYQRAYLDFHYRSQHPQLINFSNAAYYGNRLIPLPAKTEYTPIHFIEVNGLYDKHVNEQEADAVINILLHKILPLDNTTNPPSVGVATFNLYQRNLVLQKIQDLIILNNEDSNKLLALQQQGLFVKNLENIQGDERDIIILSTTFGTRTDGRFIQNFGQLNQAKGYKLFNVIITRAKYQIYVCTSIPYSYYSNYTTELQTNGITGKSSLYAYLCYAHAVTTQNTNLQNTILQQLSKSCKEPEFKKISNNQNQSPFVSYLISELKNKLPNYTFQSNANLGGFIVDILIYNENETPKWVIECDGNKHHFSEVAYLLDIHREEQIKKMNLQFIRIWSANWWLNNNNELLKLLQIMQN